MLDRFEPRTLIIAGVAIVVVAIGAFLLLKDGDDDDSQAESTGGAEAASLEDLRQVASSVEFPVYWAGERPGSEYELTVSDEGNIFVRYLDPSTPVGSRDVASLTVGTYPFPGAYEALQGQASTAGAKTAETPDGGFVLTNENNPDSVYIAYPGTDYQIEIFDPSAKTALELATSGAIVPIE